MRSERVRIIIIIVILFFVVSSFVILFETRNKASDKSHSYSSRELFCNIYTIGNIEYLDYLNSDGQLTFAADKNYARVVKTLDSESRVIREEYFDEFENRTYMTSDYCTITYDYTENSIIYHYLDENDEPVELNTGYSISERINSTTSSDYTIIYYDGNMKPVECSGGYYGISYYYNGDVLVSYTYIGSDYNPINLPSGYSTVVRTYYDDGKIETEMYYDADGNSVANSAGAYGVHFDKYYDSGKCKQMTYLNQMGNPTRITRGFSSVVYSYYSNGRVKTEMYIGLDGEPYMVDKGYYGILRDGEKKFYLDKYGHEIFHIDSLIANFPAIVVIISVLTAVLFIVLPRICKSVLLFLYIGFILYKTIFFREHGEYEAIFSVIASYSDFLSNDVTRLQIIENIWLFVPYGVGITTVIKKKNIVIFALLLPVAIEFIQLFFNIGVFELADILNNYLGEVIGMLFVYLWKNRSCKRVTA